MKICPSCKKPTIEFFAGFETGNYRCRCGYVGPIVIDEIKKKSKRKKK